ncbi:MAG: hypothetical protein Q8J97_08840 [Flavobacteriaceae bacterium]|nr:hypothetical protein [Flavobacteriaceae bacterium]
MKKRKIETGETTTNMRNGTGKKSTAEEKAMTKNPMIQHEQ